MNEAQARLDNVAYHFLGFGALSLYIFSQKRSEKGPNLVVTIFYWGGGGQNVMVRYMRVCGPCCVREAIVERADQLRLVVTNRC